ncbi:MAG TPA: VIT domain-containing protein [Thermomonas sp.]|nr:VIT domain-containing protein [Thermomonas sp.]
MKRLLITLAAGVAAIGITIGSPAQHLRPLPVPSTWIEAPGAKTPVLLERVEVEVGTAGSLARTTLLLTLRNPNARALEGTLQFPLQPGQQVTAFALDIGGVMRDAVPVPKQQGRQVFESIERRNVDPALLEQVAGNHFRLRVYPLPAGGTRQVRLVLDEPMRRDRDAWRLGLPAGLLVSSSNISLHVRGVAAAPAVEGAFSSLQWRHDGDGLRTELQRGDAASVGGLALRFPVSTAARAYVGMLGDERYVLAELPDSAASKSRSIPRHVGLLWDASASGRKRDHAGELALLDRYFRAMGDGRVDLRLLRDRGTDGGSFEVRGGDWSALRKALQAMVYDGATDLADWSPSPGIGEYLLVSDGLQNYGAQAMPALASNQRLYPLASTAADATRLAALAESRGGRLVAWQGRAGLDEATRALLADATHVVALEGEGVDRLVAQSRWVDDGVLRVAGRLREPVGRIIATIEGADGRRRIEMPVNSAGIAHAQVPQAWAAWTVASLSSEPERNRAAIARLGSEFALVTSGTSLLVLDDVADYARYDIPPPPALQAQVASILATKEKDRQASRSERLDTLAAEFAARIAWWERVFPKGALPVAESRKKAEAGASTLDSVTVTASRANARQAAASPPPPPEESPVVFSDASPADAAASAPVALMAPGTVREQDDRSEQAATPRAATIRLQAWEPDSLYARRLRDAPADQLYSLYLDERDSHAASTAFYLDVADLLLQRGRRDEALRVLSNLAELELENRHVLRVLGYRLMQARAYPLAVQVFRQVLEMAAEEPQSHRDLALALAAVGDRQQAIRHLYDVVSGQWDGRFAEIELVALNELNQIVATSPTKLDIGFIDPRLLRNLPLDLRVALSWDSDNSDMDLWVTDPNGEKCYYGHTLTYQGGLISDDFTGGYGPEEFVLRDAKPGKYKVQANFYGDRQQVVTGATTLSLRLSTGWGTGRQKDQAVTLRLSGKDETVLVGEFEVE